MFSPTGSWWVDFVHLLVKTKAQWTLMNDALKLQWITCQSVAPLHCLNFTLYLYVHVCIKQTLPTHFFLNLKRMHRCFFLQVCGIHLDFKKPVFGTCVCVCVSVKPLTFISFPFKMPVMFTVLSWMRAALTCWRIQQIVKARSCFLSNTSFTCFPTSYFISIWCQYFFAITFTTIKQLSGH